MSDSPATAPLPPAADPSLRSRWICAVLGLLILTWFFGIQQRYGGDRSQTAASWIVSAWNSENDYEHGLMFPFVIIGLIIYRFKALRAAVGPGNYLGLVVILLGALLYAAAFRTLQPRIAMGALPMLLWGSAWYLWGNRVAWMLIFPLFLFWLAIPLPTFQHATVHLQLIATSMAHTLSGLCGVETIVKGTEISSAQGKWEPLSIAGGCSGIRSLMALLMISAVWAYIAKIPMWKKILLFLSAIPLAILGNVLRVTSIFLIAEYGDARWARETWHDWSGLLLFYPISLFLLLVLHSVLEGGLPWRNARRRQLRRTTVTRTSESPA
jgi:exosortase